MFRVEEFKSQLEHVQHNMVCNEEKVDDLHSCVQQLKDLYARVDQVEVEKNFLCLANFITAIIYSTGICGPGNSPCKCLGRGSFKS